MELVGRNTTDNSGKNPALLMDTLLRVSQLLRIRLNDWLGRFELNDGRYAVLKILASSSDKGCSQAQLAHQLGLSESNVSTLIERMQRDGLVNRLKSAADRRKWVLLISPAGKTIVSRVEKSQSNWASQELNGFPAKDRAALTRLLRQLGRCLDDGLDTDCGPRLRISPIGSSAGDDPVDDPKSPQFALQQMLLALSVQAGTDGMEKDVA